MAFVFVLTMLDDAWQHIKVLGCARASSRSTDHFCARMRLRTFRSSCDATVSMRHCKLGLHAPFQLSVL